MSRRRGLLYKKGESFPIPKKYWQLGRSRTQHLLNAPHIIGSMRFEDVLANSYLQGVADAGDTVEKSKDGGCPVCPACGYSKLQ